MLLRLHSASTDSNEGSGSGDSNSGPDPTWYATGVVLALLFAIVFLVCAVSNVVGSLREAGENAEVGFDSDLTAI